ncbi:hypothetical protein KAJ02_03590 [Candidatus Bipolaricaulota bacterium]|nr:hypothetical protein [Candidatus Bipolaricaulota bacterium]
MIRTKNLWMVLGLVVSLSFAVSATAVAPWIETHAAGDTMVWFFNNTTGETANILHLEFEQEVTITNYIALGGDMVLLGPLTGTTFDFGRIPPAVGSLVKYGTFQVDLPLGAVPALAQLLKMDEVGNTIPIGSPFFTSIAVLGRLFGIGIVAVREANPDALLAAFEQFFMDNAAYLAGLSESLGMSLADSLMPIIMASPPEGIENFFNTIMGMLGVTDLSDVVAGAVDFGALFALLGM